MTTAEYRAKALDAEARLAWSEAAYLWHRAAMAYPIKARLGALGRQDCAAMIERSDACARAALGKVVQ